MPTHLLLFFQVTVTQMPSTENQYFILKRKMVPTQNYSDWIFPAFRQWSLRWCAWRDVPSVGQRASCGGGSRRGGRRRGFCVSKSSAVRRGSTLRIKLLMMLKSRDVLLFSDLRAPWSPVMSVIQSNLWSLPLWINPCMHVIIIFVLFTISVILVVLQFSALMSDINLITYHFDESISALNHALCWNCESIRYV